MIRFLIKSAFWLALAFIVMPRFFPAEQENMAPEKPAIAGTPNAPESAPDSTPDTVDQLLANGRTAIGIGKLCMDNPSFCENGTSLISGAGSGLLKGSGQMLDYLSERFGAKKDAPAQQQQAVAPARPEAPAAVKPVSAQNAIPVPTPRAEALRALDRRTTGAIPARD